MTNEGMERDKHTNYATMVESDILYPVSYTIKQDGTKVFEKTYLKGSDLTENQIKELAETVGIYCEADCSDAEYGGCCHPDHCQKRIKQTKTKRPDGV